MIGVFYQGFHFGMFTRHCHVLRIPVVQFFSQSFILHIGPFYVSNFTVECINLSKSGEFRTFCYLRGKIDSQRFIVFLLQTNEICNFTIDSFHSVFVSISAESMSLFWMNFIKSIAASDSLFVKPIFFATSFHCSGEFLTNFFSGKYRAEHS